MENIRGSLRKATLWSGVGLVVFLIFLEVGSRHYQCPISDAKEEIAVCDIAKYPTNMSKLASLEDLIIRKKQGREATQEDLDSVMTVAQQESMPGFNGYYCNGSIYVSARLPKAARYFVARHELEHAYQSNGLGNDCKKVEYCATAEAAKDYPIGFLQTIVSSLTRSFRESPTFGCFLFGSWKIFKSYILP